MTFLRMAVVRIWAVHEFVRHRRREDVRTREGAGLGVGSTARLGEGIGAVVSRVVVGLADRNVPPSRLIRRRAATVAHPWRRDVVGPKRTITKVLKAIGLITHTLEEIVWHIQALHRPSVAEYEIFEVLACCAMRQPRTKEVAACQAKP